MDKSESDLTPNATHRGGPTTRSGETRGSASAAMERIPHRLDEGDPPVSYSQQRLWFMDQLDPGGIDFNRPFAYQFDGILDVESLRSSVNEIVRRHSILRTTYPAVGGRPVQRIADPRPVRIPLIDLSGLPESERRPEAIRRASQWARRPFHLGRDLPLRPQILRLDQDRHVIVVVTHHIAFDGFSESIFMNELAGLYTARREGLEARLPEPPIQYADYAVWERQRVRGGSLDEHLAYWRAALGDLSPRPGLPALEEEPALAELAAGRETLRLGGPLSETMRAICREEGVTPFMLFFSVFAMLLHRLSGSEDIAVGMPVAGRSRLELENLIGTFVNTLPLRVDLSGSPTFRGLLRRARKAIVEALEHQEVPFERLVEEVQPERSLERPPIFDYLINSHMFHQTRIAFGDLEVGEFRLPEISTAYPLTFYIFSDAGGYRLEMSYRATSFSAGQIQRLLAQVSLLLEQATQDPNRAIGEYSLVDENARVLLPDPASAIAEVDHPAVPGLVSEWVARDPAAPAVVAPTRTYSYEDLWQRSTQLAVELVDTGLQPGQVVAVIGQRSFEMVAGMLGVLIAGGVMLLVDPDWPKGQIETMLTRSRVRIGLAFQGRSGAPPWMKEIAGLKLIPVMPDTEAWVRSGRRSLEGWPVPGASDPAYVFFTSGTTGDPEPVLGCHKGLSHFLAWERQALGIGPGDRCAMLTGLSFDPILRDVFLPLTSGGSVCIPAPELSPATERIAEWIAEQRITILHGVPSLARTWLSRRRTRKVATDLKWILLAGEPLGEDLVRRLRLGFAPEATIVNLYGPTETTLVKCFYIIPDHPSPGIQPLGSPLPQTQVLVLNADDKLCGIGEPGEIVIRTPYRTLGYLLPDSPRRASFIVNPFSPDPGDLLYRTGDRGYYRSDGQLGYLGRLDHQVKIHGTRVEPDGVAAVLAKQPGVLGSAVLASNDELGTSRLTAYVVLEDRAITAEELRDRLAQHLPAAMVPTGFVFLDELPLTPNGKMDRQALEAMAVTSVRSRTEYVPPRDRIEGRLVRIWEDVLETRPIGVRDDFFERGGHSLLAVRMFVEVERATKKRLPVRSIFEAPTVERLAALIRSDRWTPPETQLVPIQPDGSRPPVFWVHAAGGHVLAYRRLAHYLGPEQPVYALQGVNLEEDRLGDANVEDMATRYIADLQKAQPAGPYFIGGLSFGGVVAWEIAQRLRAQGQTVGLLILLDTRGPLHARPPFLRRLALELRQRIEFHGGNLSVLAPRQKLAYLIARGRATLPRLARRGWTAVETMWYLAIHPAPRAVKRAYRGDIRARSRYKPKSYSGRIAFFRSQSQPDAGEYPQMGWEGLVEGRMDIYEVPGAHVSIMAEPHLQVLAAKLNECLALAQTAAAGEQAVDDG